MILSIPTAVMACPSTEKSPDFSAFVTSSREGAVVELPLEVALVVVVRPEVSLTLVETAVVATAAVVADVPDDDTVDELEHEVASNRAPAPRDSTAAREVREDFRMRS